MLMGFLLWVCAAVVVALSFTSDIAEWVSQVQGVLDAVAASGKTGKLLVDILGSTAGRLVVAFMGLWVAYKAAKHGGPGKPTVRCRGFEVRMAVMNRYQIYVFPMRQEMRFPTPQDSAWFGEIQFVNLGSADAVNVAGHVTFIHASSGKQAFETMTFGRWAELDEPRKREELHEKSRLTITADGNPHTLNVALKLTKDVDAYGFSNQSIIAESATWCYRPYRLPPGRYFVKVHLLGSNFKKSFYFALNNPNAKQPFTLEQARPTRVRFKRFIGRTTESWPKRAA